MAAVRGAWPGSRAPGRPRAARGGAVPIAAAATAPDGPVGARDLPLPIGIAETDLRPVDLDFGADPHLLVFGDSGCGKSAFLRTLADLDHPPVPPRAGPHRRARLPPQPARRDRQRPPHRVRDAAGPATELIDSVAGYLTDRLPGPDVTPAQLRNRSWWTGPECFVLVDDYDLVAAGGDEPARRRCSTCLPQARDVGLHLVIARRCGGAGRALFEPTLARLRELATPGLIMSGRPRRGRAARLGTPAAACRPAAAPWSAAATAPASSSSRTGHPRTRTGEPSHGAHPGPARRPVRGTAG